jgi:hypothetical protein
MPGVTDTSPSATLVINPAVEVISTSNISLPGCKAAVIEFASDSVT